jgi:hypothetical protein
MTTGPPDHPGQTAPTTPAIERALARIESELSVVFASADRVEAACQEIRRAAGDWSDPSHVAALRRLCPLAHGRTGAARAAVYDLLRDAARAAPDPWALIEGLLATRDAPTCLQTLEEAALLARAGRLDIDRHRFESIARLAEADGSPLLSARCLDQIARWLRASTSPAGDGRDPVASALLDPDRPAVRRLAARLLDRGGRLPSPSVVREVLIESDAVGLGPVLTYTRAGHTDLVSLVARPREPSPLAASWPAVVDCCGQRLAYDLVGELGLARANLGLRAQRIVGVSVDDSLPLLLTPAEARLVASCPGSSRSFERVVAIAHGGTFGAAATGGPRDSAIDRFRAYNLAHAEVLVDILDIAPLTPERVERILGRMDHIAAEFVALFVERSDECQALPGLYSGLKERIRREMARSVAGRPLPIEPTRLVQMFEDPPTLADVQTLHGLKRYLHQRGLALGFGLLESSSGTNRHVDLVFAAPERVLGVVRAIEYVDTDAAGSGAGEPVAVPYPVALVVDGFVRQWLHGVETLPRVRVFCYGNEVHYFVSFRNHPVFIRVDFSPPLGGGMIDLAYYGVSKFELDDHPAIGLDGIQSLLRRLDFHVEVENTRIHARYDKERAVDLADLCEKVEALFRLVPHLMDVDWIVGGLDLPPGARRAVGDAWADFFARWGALPAGAVLSADRRRIVVLRERRPEGVHEQCWTGDGDYTDVVAGRPRPTWLSEIHAALAARSLDVRSSSATSSPDRFRSNGRCSGRCVPRSSAAPSSTRRPASSRRLRTGSSDRTRSTGSRRCSSRRCRRRERGAAGPSGHGSRTHPPVQDHGRRRRLRRRSGPISCCGSGRARSTACATMRASSGWRSSRPTGRSRVVATPRASRGATTRRSTSARWRPRCGATTSCRRGSTWRRRRTTRRGWCGRRSPRRSRAVTPGRLSGERGVGGLVASPGRAVGVARLGTEGRRPADLEGGVLCARTLVPEDHAFLFHAVAVVGTGGGILSHAGLLAVQVGRPALIVEANWQGGRDGLRALAYHRVEFDEEQRTVAGRVVTERTNVREREEWIRDGDLVAVDADTGWLRVLGQEQTSLALHAAFRTLEQARRRLVSATARDEILEQRGHRVRAMHQLEKLLARTTEPALVQHAIEEVLGGGAVDGVDAGCADQIRLLRVLLDHPTSGDLARSCTERHAALVEARSVAARDQAVRLASAAKRPDEVLVPLIAALRLDEVRSHVARVLGRVTDVPRHDGTAGVRALARSRLNTMYVETLRALREEVAVGGLRREGRHRLRQALRLAVLLGAEADDHRELTRWMEQISRSDGEIVGRLTGRFVVWPADGGLEIEPVAGSKAANLAELQHLGSASLVPAWFAVTDRAFREALAAPAPVRPGGPWSPNEAPRTLGEAIDAVLARADADPPQKASLIASLWDDVRLPGTLVGEVSAAYRRLAVVGGERRALPPGSMDGLGSRILGAGRPAPRPAGEGGDPPEPDAPFAAIRSSAREEDTERAVRAGEFDTFLFVRGADAVVAHLRRAWSGLWTARAIHDRAVARRAGRGEGGGVIVQRIAWSRVSGVLQTTNVAEGRSREMVINVGLGLGEGIVSGLVAADHVVVSKDVDPLTEPLHFRYVIADKRERVVFDSATGRGTILTGVLSHQRLRASLEYSELVELVQVATHLEAAYGYPLDIEFGFEDAALRILQVRPVPGSFAVWGEALRLDALSHGGARPTAAADR